MSDAAVFPVSVFTASVVACILYYGIIFRRVPPKRSLNYKGRLALYLATSKAGTINDLVMAVFSIGSCVLFVWETYLPPEEGTPLWMFCTELVFSTSFTFQYFVSLYTTHNVIQYLISLQAMVDVVTIIPVYVTLAAASYSLSAGVGFLRFSRVMKFTRVLRLLRLFRSVNVISSATDNAIRHQIILLMTTVISILVVTTGFVQFVGNEVEADEWGAHQGPIQFHDALYFTVVTFTTVGYGDVAPSGVVGRLVITALIAITFVLVPFETSKLVRLARLRSAYAGVLSVRDGHSHIIVCCDLECLGVHDFLKEFFHEDHGAQNTRVCLLVPGEPTMQSKELLLRHKRLSYLKGDAMAAEDLARARADVAVGCFILTNRFCADADEQDSITILRSLNVKSFNPNLDTFVQVIEPENVCHVVSAGVREEHIVCVDAAKLGLLGQSCAFPGFSTLVTNLISSVSYAAGNVTEPWQREYVYGLMQEIYQLKLPPAFAGSPFPVVAYAVYKRYGASLFAVGVPTTDGYDVRLNPGSECIIEEGFLGFCIAEDQRSIDEIVTDADATMLDPDIAEIVTPNHRLLKTRFLDQIGLPPEYEPTVDGSGAVTPAGLRRPSAADRMSMHSGYSGEGSEGGGDDSKADAKGAAASGSAAEEGERRTLLPPIKAGGKRSSTYGETGGTGGTDPAARRASDEESAKGDADVKGRGGAGNGSLAAAAADRDGAGESKAGAEPGTPSSRVLVALPSRRGFDGLLSEEELNEASAAVASGSTPMPSAVDGSDGSDEVVAVGSADDLALIPMDSGASSSSLLRQLSGRGVAVHGTTAADEAGRDRRKLARATLLAKFEEVIDNMYGTAEEDFLDDLAAVMNIVMIDPGEQARTRCQFVPVNEAGPAGAASRRVKRRSSFVGKSSLAPRVKRRAFEDAVRDSLVAPVDGDAGSLVHDHVLVVCSSMDDLQYLIAPLRSPYLTRQPPVVVLCAEPPDEREWSEIAPFEDVYFLEGVPHLRDLHRASISTASVAVILARAQGTADGGAFSANDAEVVLTVLDIQASVRSNMRTLAELNSSRYMKHLGAPVQIRRRMSPEAGIASALTSSDDGYIFESSYSSGRVLPANFLEALLCQAYFNPYIVMLVNVLASGCPMDQTHSLPVEERAARMAALDHDEEDKDSSKSDDNVSVVSNLDLLAASRKRRSYAVQVPVPVEMRGKRYDALLQHMLFKFDMLPIALYRYGEKLGNALPFVYTNPPADTIICAADLVFVLAPYERLVPEA
mmetsp:Transcript_26577/g.92376  ORF Transcript_26577/g.92376 Transcript_26577/m.92376 type:complete len:1263 (-) Transcript_26577:93-3881(-)